MELKEITGEIKNVKLLKSGVVDNKKYTLYTCEIGDKVFKTFDNKIAYMEGLYGTFKYKEEIKEVNGKKYKSNILILENKTENKKEDKEQNDEILEELKKMNETLEEIKEILLKRSNEEMFDF